MITAGIKDLKNQLTVTESVTKYANKYVAHAADPVNREKIAKILLGLSLNHFESCYKAIIQVSIKVGLIINEFITTEVAVPQYDQFENWNKPLLTATDKDNLHVYWNNRVNLIGKMADFDEISHF